MANRKENINKTSTSTTDQTSTDISTIIVRYNDTVDVATKIDFLTSLSANIRHIYNSINALSCTIPKNNVSSVQSDIDVMYVEICTPTDVHILGFESKGSETEFEKLKTVLKATPSSQITPWGISKIRADQVQSGGDKGTGIKVVIEDTGIDFNHPDLQANFKGGWNFVGNNSNPDDDFGHGTHCAGIAAAADNGIGVLGVAPEASLIAYKVLDSNGNGSFDNIIAGIQRGINENVQVISMSFGGSGFSQALSDICNAAKNAGIVLVAAAGNSDGDGSQDTIGYPAKLSSVIAVAATDINDNRASFSSTGTELWVAAPGVDILSTVPLSGTAISDPSGYKLLSGTSMATPHTSGTVALLLKASPSLTPDQVASILSKSSIDLGPSGRDVFFGFGRIDALNAVNAISPTPTPTPPPGQLETITIPSSESIQVGNTIKLTPICRDANNNTIPCTPLTWASDKSAVATVDSMGNVTGQSPGTANIKAVDGVISGTTVIMSNKCVVTVTPLTPPPSRFKYSVTPLGNIGVIVTRTPIDGVDVDTACAQSCAILKTIDSMLNAMMF